MICQDCRRETAPVGIYDAGRGKNYELCEDCAPPTCAVIAWLEKRADEPVPTWSCPVCAKPAKHGLPILRDPQGVLHYRHRDCDQPFPPGWEEIPTMTITAVNAATPEVAAALGIEYVEPPPHVKEAMERARRERERDE